MKRRVGLPKLTPKTHNYSFHHMPEQMSLNTSEQDLYPIIRLKNDENRENYLISQKQTTTSFKDQPLQMQN